MLRLEQINSVYEVYRRRKTGFLWVLTGSVKSNVLELVVSYPSCLMWGCPCWEHQQTVFTVVSPLMWPMMDQTQCLKVY